MESTPVIPQTYAEWRHCIEAECRIPLEKPFIAARIAALSRVDHEETQRFIKLYGEQHWTNVLRWFQQADRDAAVRPMAG